MLTGDDLLFAAELFTGLRYYFGWIGRQVFLGIKINDQSNEIDPTSAAIKYNFNFPLIIFKSPSAGEVIGRWIYPIPSDLSCQSGQTDRRINVIPTLKICYENIYKPAEE